MVGSYKLNLICLEFSYTLRQDFIFIKVLLLVVHEIHEIQINFAIPLIYENFGAISPQIYNSQPSTRF